MVRSRLELNAGNGFEKLMKIFRLPGVSTKLGSKITFYMEHLETLRRNEVGRLDHRSLQGDPKQGGWFGRFNAQRFCVTQL